MLVRNVRQYSKSGFKGAGVDREWYQAYYDEFKKDKSEDKATAIKKVLPQVKDLISTVNERTVYILLQPIAKTGRNAAVLDELFQGFVDKLRTNNYDHT